MMRAIAWILGVVVALAVPVTPAWADDSLTIRLVRGHSRILNSTNRVATVAVGNSGVARATAVTNTSILINAVQPGSTSLTLILKSGGTIPYRVIVTHDLVHLARHLQMLDPRIRVESDPNGDAVILSGIVKNKAVVERAFEAATRYFGQTTVSITTNPRESREQLRVRAANGQGAASSAAAPSDSPNGGDPIAGAEGERSHITEELASGSTRVINLLVTEESLVTAGDRLQQVLQRVDGNITVEEVNGVFILRGKVATPAALSRALALADRFVRGDGDPSFSVISDRGGVLAGNLDPSDEFEPVVDPLALPSLGNRGSRSLSSRSGGSSRSRYGTSQTLPVEISPPKGNLGQNVSRADVVMVANGRVMSLLEVREQPRVEIKMSIVAVDRNRTEDLGINWRIDGSRVTVSTTGGRVFTPPNDPVTSLPPVPLGGVNAVAKLIGGTTTVQAFLQALEQTGAAQSVSEPILSAVSGESTSFLIGGNIPLPVETVVPGTPTQNALVVNNVEFIEFGLRIVARPTVLENGRIGIVLDQLFTEPDPSRAITIDGVVIPGFKQRSVRTLTESQDGETWAVAGLVSDTDSKSTSAVPLIARFPVLGALFRSKSNEKLRSELIVTVTARRVPEGGFDAMTPAAAAPAAPAATDAGARVSTAPLPPITTVAPVTAAGSASTIPHVVPGTGQPARTPNWSRLDQGGRR
ncbi:MAG: pilus assembly protein N-terminal domain-containing protein [Burkholderiales bacterium]|nr:pilus assembly protein N-terminal domain-containing protein [Burkholderiales bacterium]MCW5620632.1 pilus assembly protein N-terminal domain-containing protein [Burkholderiales bacterium]